MENYKPEWGNTEEIVQNSSYSTKAIQAMDPTKPFCMNSGFNRYFFGSLPGIMIIVFALISSMGICSATMTSDDYGDQGDSWYQDGEYAAAISAYLNAITINPDNSEAWNGLGLAYTQDGQYTLAISAFRQAVSINPAYTEAWNNLGDTYAKNGQYDKAREAYQRAITKTSAYQQNRMPIFNQEKAPYSDWPASPGMMNQRPGPDPGPGSPPQGSRLSQNTRFFQK